MKLYISVLFNGVVPNAYSYKYWIQNTYYNLNMPNKNE